MGYLPGTDKQMVSLRGLVRQVLPSDGEFKEFCAALDRVRTGEAPGLPARGMKRIPDRPATYIEENPKETADQMLERLAREEAAARAEEEQRLAAARFREEQDRLRREREKQDDATRKHEIERVNAEEKAELDVLREIMALYNASRTADALADGLQRILEAAGTVDARTGGNARANHIEGALRRIITVSRGTNFGKPELLAARVGGLQNYEIIKTGEVVGLLSTAAKKLYDRHIPLPQPLRELR